MYSSVLCSCTFSCGSKALMYTQRLAGHKSSSSPLCCCDLTIQQGRRGSQPIQRMGFKQFDLFYHTLQSACKEFWSGLPCEAGSSLEVRPQNKSFLMVQFKSTQYVFYKNRTFTEYKKWQRMTFNKKYLAFVAESSKSHYSTLCLLC